MKRRLFNALAAVSVMLFVATIFCWFKSYNYNILLRWNFFDGQTSYKMEPCDGELRLSRSKFPTPVYGGSGIAGNPLGLQLRWTKRNAPVENRNLARFEFVNFRNQLPAGYEITHVRAPLWFVLCVLSVLPSCVVLFRLRSRRAELRQHNVCEHCNYDLRATPERCPECGTVGETRNDE